MLAIINMLFEACDNLFQRRNIVVEQFGIDILLRLAFFLGAGLHGGNQFAACKIYRFSVSPVGSLAILGQYNLDVYSVDVALVSESVHKIISLWIGISGLRHFLF